MKTLCILLLISALQVQAKSLEKSTYTINGKPVQFLAQKADRILVSSNCLKRNKLACLAYTTLSKVSFNKISQKNLNDGKNPGAIICQQQLKAQVVIGTNKFGSNSFCLFKDGSIIDSGTLIFYGVKNDQY